MLYKNGVKTNLIIVGLIKVIDSLFLIDASITAKYKKY